jgi:hypothetical protein
VWAAGGLMGRLGAAKRRMLSLAEGPSPLEVAAWEGVAEGIVAGYASIDDLELQLLDEKANCAELSVGSRYCTRCWRKQWERLRLT